ncbi:MoxR family ATPase [Idiomarina sp. M1R2S28]|uniref:MoxR family ATPase n=1 Tax=Idiomarina rhizosphaerae TaxID=2961572 RepID=A0A9X2G0W1_9GAMM|nr:MoxR family ATPase [Idiomarina rhizosphaerae]MCP1338318.1 MoxR family ATPase [Idiomarina rhizosphaerae]
MNNSAKQDADLFKQLYQRISEQVGRVMVGQRDVIDGVLTALFAGGHVLLEGVPGLGKTQLINALSHAVNLNFSRIQFTPDMMPADIIGSAMLTSDAKGDHQLQFQQGPVVANLVLADEINRATPKTQAALLEVMQEKQISTGRNTIKMPEPFCVMATQNPVDQEGTYPLPEAQLDRFLFKLVVGYPNEQDYHTIIDRTTSNQRIEIDTVADAPTLCLMQQIVRQVPVPEIAKSYAIRLVMGTQPHSDYANDEINRYVALGASPRGIQGLLLAAKVRALVANRYAVSVEDIQAIAMPVLRHRLVINFQGQAAGITSDKLLQKLLKDLKTPYAID